VTVCKKEISITAFVSFSKKLLISCSRPCGSYDLKNLILSFGIICYNGNRRGIYQYYQTNRLSALFTQFRDPLNKNVKI
jgi:hypothetical protein